MLVGVLYLVGAVGPAGAAPRSAAQQLAGKYAPVVMVRSQDNGVCDTSEEQYAPPTSVDAVLGDPRVRLLVHDAHSTRLVQRAPTATELAGLGNGYYLDLPGNPLNPGCTYAKDFAALKRAGRAPAVVYAHIARETGQVRFCVAVLVFLLLQPVQRSSRR